MPTHGEAMQDGNVAFASDRLGFEDMEPIGTPKLHGQYMSIEPQNFIKFHGQWANHI
jgi:hypothetical protein